MTTSRGGSDLQIRTTIAARGSLPEAFEEAMNDAGEHESAP